MVMAAHYTLFVSLPAFTWKKLQMSPRSHKFLLPIYEVKINVNLIDTWIIIVYRGRRRRGVNK